MGEQREERRFPVAGHRGLGREPLVGLDCSDQSGCRPVQSGQDRWRRTRSVYGTGNLDYCVVG